MFGWDTVIAIVLFFAFVVMCIVTVVMERRVRESTFLLLLGTCFGLLAAFVYVADRAQNTVEGDVYFEILVAGSALSILLALFARWIGSRSTWQLHRHQRASQPNQQYELPAPNFDEPPHRTFDRRV